MSLFLLGMGGNLEDFIFPYKFNNTFKNIFSVLYPVLRCLAMGQALQEYLACYAASS